MFNGCWARFSTNIKKPGSKHTWNDMACFWFSKPDGLFTHYIWCHILSMRESSWASSSCSRGRYLIVSCVSLCHWNCDCIPKIKKGMIYLKLQSHCSKISPFRRRKRDSERDTSCRRSIMALIATTAGQSGHRQVYLGHLLPTLPLCPPDNKHLFICGSERSLQLKCSGGARWRKLLMRPPGYSTCMAIGSGLVSLLAHLFGNVHHWR